MIIIILASLPGSLLSTKCPNDASGLAIRECKQNGWAPPQLGQCTGRWLTDLASSYTSRALSPSQLSSRLSWNLQEKKLFGGDIIGALDLSERLIKNAQFESAGNEEQQNIHLQNLASGLSSLLERESLPGWLDLSQVIIVMVLITKMITIIWISPR